MPVLFSSTPSPLKGGKCWVSVSFAFKLAEVFGALGNTSLKEECKSFSISSQVYFHFPIITFVSNPYITLRFSQPRIEAYCGVTVGFLVFSQPRIEAYYGVVWFWGYLELS